MSGGGPGENRTFCSELWNTSIKRRTYSDFIVVLVTNDRMVFLYGVFQDRLIYKFN